MDIDKIDVWEDPRVLKLSAYLNGKTYGYWYAEPEGPVRGTIFLVHGFPDLSAAWRYTIPMFLSLGLKVIAIDFPGYGRSDAPVYTMKDYTFKQVSDDIAELARQLKCQSIILGGHDWGGLIVQRCAQYHPNLVSHLFTLSTPYFPIQPTFEPLNLLVKRFQNWNYMVQFASGELEPAIQSKTEIRNFLNSCLGFPSGPNGEVAFTPDGGAVVENLSKTLPTPLFTDREMDFYSMEFARHGLRGPFTWYRTREHNFADEYEHFLAPRGTGAEQLREDPGIEQDVLHILTKRDRVFDVETCRATESGFKKLTKKEIDADHWALWEKPQVINDVLTQWLREVVFQDEKRT